MKQVMMLYKRLNFNSTGASRFKMRASLKHSLRIIDEFNESEKDGWQWDESRTDSNLIYINDELKNFSEFLPEEREKLLDDCFAPPQPLNKKSLVKTYSAYKIKLKNAVDKETNSEAKVVLQAILNTPQDQEIDANVFVAQLEPIAVVRKNQRIGMIERFADAHNALLGTVDKKKTFIQEGIFKFPRPKNKNQDELTNELSPENYIFHMRHFLQTYFADYPIKTIVAHVDEDKVHSHYYLSGLNSQTNELDLNKREIEVVNNYIRTLKGVDLISELIPVGKKLNYAERQRFGRHFQRFFYEFTNQHLLNPKGVEAIISDEAERKSDIAIKRNNENRLPKGFRSHNLAKLEAELAEEKAKRAEAKIKEAKALVEKVNKITAAKINKITEAKAELKVINDEIFTGKAEAAINEQVNAQLNIDKTRMLTEIESQQIVLDKLKDEIDDKKFEFEFVQQKINETVSNANAYINEVNQLVANKENQLKTIQSDIFQAKTTLESINDRVAKLVGNVIYNIQIRAMAISKNFNSANDYVKKIMTDYSQIAPAFLRDICKAAAKDAKDTEIVEKMESKDKELDETMDL